MSVLAAAMAASWPATFASCWHVLNGGDQLALLYVIALLHIEVGDAAHRGGAEVDIGLWLDLAGAADDRGQVLRTIFAVSTLV